MPQPHNILLSPVDSRYHTPESVIIPADCGHEAWIAPSSLALVLNAFMATRTVCMRCADKTELAKAIREGNMRAVPGAKDELAAVVGQDLANDLYRNMNVTELLEP